MAINFHFTSPTALIPALFGIFITIFGMFSMFIKEKLFLSETIIATLFGIVIGPYGLNLLNTGELVEDVDTLTFEFSRFIIGLQVMAAGITLPKRYLWKKRKSLLVMLSFGMVSMWIVSALVIMTAFHTSFLTGLLLASIVTPTDPVLSNSIVKGRFAEMYVPVHTRDLISAESGANDGLGFPFVFLPLLLMTKQTVGEAITEWILEIWLYQIIFSVVLGAIFGVVGRKFLKFAERRSLVDKESFLSFSIAFALLILGLVSLVGSDDILAVFVAGNAFTWDDWFRRETEEAHLQEVIDMFLNIGFFIYFGTIIPWDAFSMDQYGISFVQMVICTVLILLFRRLPSMLVMYPFVPELKSLRDALFAGWFGPIGVGAVFYSIIAKRELLTHFGKDSMEFNIIFPVCVFLVMSSIIVHGITVPLFYLGSKIPTSKLKENIATPQPWFNSNEKTSWMKKMNLWVKKNPDTAEMEKDEAYSSDASNFA